MNGVSNMLPFVVGGGLLIAISFIFGINASDPTDPSYNPIAGALMTIGSANAFQLMIPVLAGFIAMSIADRPGLAPGMIGGLMETTGGAGFFRRTYCWIPRWLCCALSEKSCFRLTFVI